MKKCSDRHIYNRESRKATEETKHRRIYFTYGIGKKTLRKKRQSHGLEEEEKVDMSLAQVLELEETMVRFQEVVVGR